MEFRVYNQKPSTQPTVYRTYAAARAVAALPHILVEHQGTEYTLDTTYLDKMVGWGTTSQREPKAAEVRKAFFR